MARKEWGDMNETIAANIRHHREHFAWTQEQLAGAAELNVRTIQRAEEGRAISAETLTAIAGALDVSLEQLRTDEIAFLAGLLGVEPEEVTPELIAARIDEEKAKYHTIPLVIVRSSTELGAIFRTKGVYFDCIPDAEEIQDLAAELKQWLLDLSDLAGDLTPLDERNYLKSAYEIVHRLKGDGCVVALGIHHHALRLDQGESIPWSTLYVLVTRTEEARKFIMVEKGARVEFV